MQPKLRSVLFLGTSNDFGSRFAEVLFNSVAGKMGLPWQASSRELACDRGPKHVGPMTASAIKAMEAMSICAADAVTRPPVAVVAGDLAGADRIVALSKSEHLPIMQERFPAWSEKVEFWNVDDGPEALNVIEREVMGLVARILGGGERLEAEQSKATTGGIPLSKEPPKKAITLKVGRETAGRRGKGVTTVFDMPLSEAAVLDLAAQLKHRCGTGGTVKNGRIEIQGDQRERIVGELEKLGYKVKRVGG